MSDELVREVIDLGLARMNRLMELLGHPERDFAVIHAAGTNGKGSTCEFIASILNCAGLKTGKYQSPAVFDPLEIISVCGRNISRKNYEALCRTVLEKSGTLKEEGLDAPTLFEVQTAAAFLYFREMKCSAAVIEAGLGGDMDATNVVMPAAAVFTPIGMDHTSVLGSTLEQIALHKSGIIKAGCEVFSAVQTEEANAILKQCAARNGCDFTTAKMIDEVYICGSCVVCEAGMPSVRLGISGRHQAENAALALTVLNGLRDRHISPFSDIEEERWKAAVTAGLKNARLHGRFERVRRQPDIYIDGAHNPAAAVWLRRELDELEDGLPVIYIFGAFADKDYILTAKTVIKNWLAVLCVEAFGKRGVKAGVLADDLKRELNIDATPCEDVRNAIETAVKLAGEYREKTGKWIRIVCFGSLSWLGDARAEAKRLLC